MPKKIFHFALIGILSACPLFCAQTGNTEMAEDKQPQIQHKITVTATRIDTPTREVGSSVTVITSQDIDRSRKTTVLEMLQTVPDLILIQNGPMGASASIHIRGGNAEHTLVMMDGVQINDPISPSRSIDLAHLSLDNVEQIEILRAPQSTLYGSDALGGVINIITKRGQGPPSVVLSSQGGSYGTISGSSALSGGTENISYSLGTSFTQTTGFSAASQTYEGNSEKDGYHNITLTGRLGFRLSDNVEFDFSARRTETESDIDNFGGSYGDDPNNLQTYDSIFFKGQTRVLLWNNRWEQRFKIAFVEYDRSYANPADALHPFDSENASYKSSFFNIDWQHNLYFSESNTLTLGINFQQEQGESSYVSESFYGPFESLFPLQKARITGFYLQDLLRLPGQFFLSLGIRLDSHSQFGTSMTYRLAPVYLFEKTGTKIKGSIGTGFKSPSLYQLFAPATFYGPVGNADLEPAKSTGWDAGIEQPFFKGRIRFCATYFCHLYKNLIDFDYAFGYINIAEARSRGLELLLEASPLESLRFSAGYTLQKAIDVVTEEALLRRPRDHFQANLNFLLVEKINLDFSLKILGERDDMEFSRWTSRRVQMPSFTLFNAAASYDVLSHAQIFLRLENILNTEYEMIRGYGTPGFSFYGGFRVIF
jgi:vitamin B12 transporter